MEDGKTSLGMDKHEYEIESSKTRRKEREEKEVKQSVIEEGW